MKFVLNNECKVLKMRIVFWTFFNSRIRKRICIFKSKRVVLTLVGLIITPSKSSHNLTNVALFLLDSQRTVNDSNDNNVKNKKCFILTNYNKIFNKSKLQYDFNKAHEVLKFVA